MKRNAIARIVIYSLLFLVLSSILVAALALDGFMFVFGESDGTVVEKSGSVSAADIRNLEIDWAAGDIKLITADTDQITFTETASENSKYKMTFDISGDTLKLNYGTARIGIGFGSNSIPAKDLTVTVPRDWVCEELEIDGAALNISIRDLHIERLDLDGASNTMDFSGHVDEVEIDGASNDISLICINRVAKIDVDGASCELELQLPKNCGFTVDIDGLSCKMVTTLPYIDQDGKAVYGDGKCKIYASGLSCDVIISESDECGHEWDTGYPTVEPSSGKQVTVYTCLLCGKTKSE